MQLQAVPQKGVPAAAQLLTFRVDVMDRNRNWNYIETIAIELRDLHITGRIQDGDWVEIGKRKAGGRVKELNNLTTGERVFSRFYGR